MTVSNINSVRPLLVGIAGGGAVATGWISLGRVHELGAVLVAEGFPQHRVRFIKQARNDAETTPPLVAAGPNTGDIPRSG